MKKLKSIIVTAMLLMATVATKATPTVGLFLENEQQREFRFQIESGTGVVFYFVVEVDGTPFHFNEENLHITDFYLFSLPEGIEYKLTHARTTDNQECIIDPQHKIIYLGLDIEVNLELPPTICQNGGKIDLDEKLNCNIPYERKWYEGAGVTEGHFFDPSLTKPGPKSISVTVVYCGQEYGHTAYIEVWDMPEVSLWLPSEVFVNESPFVLSGGRPYGGSYSTDLGDYCIVNGNTFDPGRAGVGWHNVYYTYTTTAGCQDVAQGKIYVRMSGNDVEETIEDNFAVYPNPTDGVVYFTKPCSVDIFSTICLVRRENSFVGSIDISDLPNGVYVFRLFDGENIAVKRMVKK